MSFFIDDLLGQTVATPFVVAFVLALALRLALGPALGRKLAVAGAAVAFLFAFTLIQGLPDFPPVASGGKTFYIVLIGAVLGLGLDLAGATRSGGHALAFIVPLAALAWLIASNPITERLWQAALLLVASILVYWRVAATARGSDEEANRAAGLFPPILVLVAAVSLSLLALLGASASLSSLAAALAAATGGFLLASYLVDLAGRLPLRFDAIGAFGVAGALLALAYVMLLFNQETNRLSLAVLLLRFVFDFWARPAALGPALGYGTAGRIVRPLMYGVIVAVPAVAAVGYVFGILGQRPG